MTNRPAIIGIADAVTETLLAGMTDKSDNEYDIRWPVGRKRSWIDG